MAKKFRFKDIAQEETWVIIHKNADGVQEKFFNEITKEIENSEFPNLDITVEEFESGGFFSKESTKMLCMKAKKSLFNGFEIFFRAQKFGNVVVYSRFECLPSGFFSKKTGVDIYQDTLALCSNLAQYEEFIALDQLADLIFEKSIQLLDPEYKDKKMLMKIGND